MLGYRNITALIVFLIFLTKNVTPQNYVQWNEEQEQEHSLETFCGGKATCSECIQTQRCSWCLDPSMDSKPRCFYNSFPRPYCQEEYQWSPDSEEMRLSMSPVSSPQDKWERNVQISPQHIYLKLRLGQEHQIELKFSQTEDYPMDLYFLIDLSKSMENDKEKILKLGDLLAQTLKNITSNFRLGFGSFVSKAGSTKSANLEDPAAYKFKNHVSLSTDTGFFAEELRKISFAGTSDGDGDGLEAIMQAIVCRSQIGWRENARRLLVFSTNAGFRYAADGVLPTNDGECHSDSQSTGQDDPSISQLDSKILQNRVNVILAVTSSQQKPYWNLSYQLTGASSGILSDDSSNVAELVRENYNKISSSVEMTDDAKIPVKVSYSSSCLRNWMSPSQTNACDGLRIGDVVSFNVNIVVRTCPKNKSEWKQTLHIHPIGINQSLTVDLETICSCPCENLGHTLFELNSTKCSEFGTYKCGVCECDEFHHGPKCELNIGERNHCRPEDSSTIDCNGRGTCVDGICECDKRSHHEEVISGQYCECDNFSCDRYNGLLCSDHGTCSCGVCQCQPGWIGNGCECQGSNDTCKSYNGEICSGHGACICGACMCDATEDGRFSGRFCEKCPTCPGLCEELRDCVQCQMYKTGPLSGSDECATNCTKFVPIPVDEAEADEDNGERLCTFYDEDDCRFQFVYTDSDELKVKAQMERECPSKVKMQYFILGLVIVVAVIILYYALKYFHIKIC